MNRTFRDHGAVAIAERREEYVYDAFFSYASEPDRHLVRAAETFLEGLHKNPLVEAQHRRELEVCVDGSDFKKPRHLTRVAPGDEHADPVFTLITEYMARSRSLIVFVGPRSREHRWLTAELRWWLQHRGTQDLHFVLSHGTDSTATSWLPAEALEAGFDKVIWFDFRGANGASLSNRIFEEERLRLAAALMGEGVAAGDLIKVWRVRAAAAKRRRNLQLAAVTAVVAGLSVGLIWALRDALARSEEAKVGIWTTLANAGSTDDPDRRLDALAFGAAALRSKPSAEAYRAVADSLQIVARPLTSKVLDATRHAVDAVAYLGGDNYVAAAGFDQTARLLRRSDLQEVAQIRLEGRAVSITDVRDKSLLIVLTRKGVDVLRYSLGPKPSIELIGRATTAPVQAGESSNRGQTLAGAIDFANGILFLSSTSGRVEWYRLADATPDGWRPFHGVNLVGSQDLPFGPFGLAFVTKTNRLIAADASGEVMCLDARTGRQIGQRFRHVSDIFAMTTHQPSGAVVAADSRGGWISINPTTCAPQRTVEPRSPVGSVAANALGVVKGGPQVDAARTSVSFSPDGSLVSVTGHDGTARVSAAATAAQVAIAPHTAMTRSSAISSSGRELAVSTSSGELTFWQIDGGAERMRISDIEDVAVNTNGSRALAIGHGVLSEIDLETGAVLAVTQDDDFKGFVHVAATASPDAYVAWRIDSGYWSKVLTSSIGSGKRQIRTTRMDAGIEQRVRVRSIRPTEEGGLLLAAYGDKRYVQFLGKDGAVRFYRELQGDPLTAAAMGSNAIAVADSSGTVVVIELSTVSGAPPAAPAGRAIELWRKTFDANTVVMDAAGKTLIAAGKRNGKPEIEYCDLSDSSSPAPSTSARPKLLCKRIGGVSQNVLLAAVARDGSAAALVVSGQDSRPDSGSVVVLRRSDGWTPRTLTSSGRVADLRFSPDGKSLAVGERRGLSLWSVESLTPQVALPTPSPVRRVAFRERSQTERLLLSIDGLTPEILRIWETNARAFVARACDRWPVGRLPPAQRGVPPVPTREEICDTSAAAAAATTRAR